MAFIFGDSFDLYAAPADMVNGYWDSGINLGTPAFVVGRFAGSQAFQVSASNTMTKISSANDAVHHLVVAFRQTAAISGSTLGAYLQLLDGVTGQCAVVFRSDGAILLTSGTAAGATLATYTGAFTVTNTWYAFEIEINVSNTAGYMNVRKNGNTSNDFSSATNLNTRPTSTNNYANKLTMGMQVNVGQQQLDDLFWRSDASSVAWLGDIRCYTRMPASDVSVQFSRTPTNFFAQSTATTSTTTALTAGTIRATSVIAPTTGTLASLSFNFNAGITGHAKMALYDATGASGGAGTLLASSAELTNPGAGVNTFTVTAGPTVTRGTTYWVALWSDVSITPNGAIGITTDQQVLTYTTTFPSPFVVGATNAIAGMGSNGMNVTPLNAGCVNEPQQDATTSYVYDSTPGDADFYGIGSIGSTPASTIAVTTRGYLQKSDAGSRTAAVQLKSGATTVATPTLTLSSSGWLWAWRTDITDPATGAAWTAAAVNNITVGPQTVT